MINKYLILFTLANFLMLGMGFSQDSLMTDWVIVESSPLPNGNAEAWAIGSDQIGNLVWGVNKDMPGLFQFIDALVYKLDEDRNVIWIDTAATGPFAQQSYHLRVSDNSVYLVGRTCSAIGIDSCDALLATTDLQSGSTGWNFIWDGGFGYEEIDGISVESDGIILTGWTKGKDTEIDVLLMKIDFEGNVIWQTIFGGSGARDDHQDGHMVVDDSMIYISGLYDGSPLLGWDGSALLAKFDKATGAFIDSLTYGRNDIWVNAENALGMTTDGTHLYTTGYTTTSVNNWDIFVAKFDKDLNQIWYSTWGGVEDTESSRAITVDADGAIYIGGSTSSFGRGGFDVVLLKFDAKGDFTWYKTWGGSLDDQTLDIYLDQDDIYLTGKSQSFHPTQKWEAILLKVPISSTTSISDPVKDLEPQLNFFPNPMTHSATLKLPLNFGKPQRFVLYDVMGREVISINSFSTQEIMIERNDFGSGVYFFRLIYSDRREAIGKLMMN